MMWVFQQLSRITSEALLLDQLGLLVLQLLSAKLLRLKLLLLLLLHALDVLRIQRWVGPANSMLSLSRLCGQPSGHGVLGCSAWAIRRGSGLNPASRYREPLPEKHGSTARGRTFLSAAAVERLRRGE